MNYKEMLDKFEYLEQKLTHLELENRYLKERVTKLEGNWWYNLPKPQPYTPVPQAPNWPNPNYIWCSTETTINPQDAFK